MTKLAPGAIPFQDDLQALLAEPAPRGLTASPWWLAGMVAALVAGAAVAPVDIVVTGPGRLMPDAPPVVLQPMERAILREILVRPGDAVRAGQVLARLDPTFAAADRAALDAEARSLRAQAARVAAEIAGAPPPLGADAESLMQAALHARRAAVHAARRATLEAEAASLAESLRAATAARPGLLQQVALAREVAALRQRLLEGQIGSRLNLLAAQSALLEAERAFAQGESRAAELAQALAAKRAERDAYLQDRERALAEDAVRLRDALARLDEQAAKAGLLDQLTTVVAPADGVVLEVARRSAGSVLREAEALVTLVPADAPLIAEVALRSADVGHLRIGDPVTLKVDAFPFQRHGAVTGRLRAISRDSFDPHAPAGAEPASPSAGAIHRAQVAIEATPNLPPGAALIPGMTLAAEVKAGSRSVLGYVLDPLIRGLGESFREP